MDIKIKDKIGEGVDGTTFKIKYEGKVCLYKIQKYEFADNDFTSHYYRLVDFDHRIAKKFPDKFMNLIAHGFIEKCSHNQEIPKWARGSFRRILMDRNKRESCLYLIYDPIYKITLDELWPTMTKKEYFRCCYQIAEQFSIMKENGFYHLDAHVGNIMMDHSGNFHLIDYDHVSNREYPINRYDQNKIDRYGSLEIVDFCFFLFNVLVKQYKWVKFVSDNHYNFLSYSDFKELLIKHPDIDKCLKYMPADAPKTKKELDQIDSLYLFLLDVVFSILFPNEYYHIKGIPEWKTMPNMFDQFDNEYIFYVIKNYKNWDLIAKEAKKCLSRL